MTPTDAKILTGETVMFRVTVHNAAESGVTWTLSGTEYSGETCGVIGSDGLYTAPPSVPGQIVVTARATSKADPPEAGYLNDLWLFERKNYASSQPK